MANSFVRIVNDDGGCTSTLPNPAAVGEVEWRLRHMPESLTRADHMVAASVISAYIYLTREATIARRNEVVRKLRQHIESAQRTGNEL